MSQLTQKLATISFEADVHTPSGIKTVMAASIRELSKKLPLRSRNILKPVHDTDFYKGDTYGTRHQIEDPRVGKEDLDD